MVKEEAVFTNSDLFSLPPHPLSHQSVGKLPSTWRKGGSGWLLSPGIPGRKFLLVENVCVRGKTSSFPPALAQRMNQNRCPRDKTPGEPRPPSYQAEVFNPFVGQPAPPGHSHAAGPAAPRSPPASPTSSGGRRGSGYSGAACGAGVEGGGAGWGRGGKDWMEARRRRRARPGGVCAPVPGLPSAADSALAGSALRPPAARTPCAERALPGCASPPRRAGPFVWGRACCCRCRRAGCPGLGSRRRSPAASARPAWLRKTHQDVETGTQT